MPTIGYHIRGLVKAVGIIKSIKILTFRVLGIEKYVTVKVRDFNFVVRTMDSDLFVLSQIFGWEEYRIDSNRLKILRNIVSKWLDAGLTPVIIDAGANVGYSSLYFYDTFPGVCILSIEPDPTSFSVLKLHTQAYSHIKPVNAALWSHDRGLELMSSDTGSWGTQVTEGAGVPSNRLDALIGEIPNARTLIIKLDIEGAEREVVESCPEIFIDTKCIVVEPHDFKTPGSACLFPLYKVAGQKKFDTILNGENIFLFSLD